MGASAPVERAGLCLRRSTAGIRCVLAAPLKRRRQQARTARAPGSPLPPGQLPEHSPRTAFELKVLETTLLAWHSGVLPPVSQSQTQSVLGLFHD